ncbi:MAG TPA: hypothetical protein VGF55_24780 [Gemmataceae bacterium]|jgi:hypothetical protein
MVDEAIYEMVLRRLREWEHGFRDPTEPLYGPGGEAGGVMRSPRQIVSEVERRTPAGRQFVENWVRQVGPHRIAQARLF